MALLVDPDDIPQGASTAVSDAVFASPSGATITITSVATELPVLGANDFFEVRDHSDTVNNGLYQESGGTPTTGSVTADKVIGSNPIANAVGEAINTLGNTTTEKVIMYDTTSRDVLLLKQALLSDDGVNMQVVYSRMMIDWKDDSFLIAAAPFPMLSIDADAGKYFIGQDASGNNNGWAFRDVISPVINTRKLLRGAGWSEVDSAGVVLQTYAGIITLGAFEDPTNDNAYYFFGTDTAVNNKTDFDFNGPVNEAIRCFDFTTTSSLPLVSIVTTLNDTITRPAGSYITDGYIVGGKMEVSGAEDAQNDSVIGQGYKLLTVGALVVTVGTLARAAATEGFDFVDGGGGNDSCVRNDGLSWIDEGYKVGGAFQVRNATTVANDGAFTILTLTATTVGVVTASFTADTDDNTANFGPLVNNVADGTWVSAVDNKNLLSLRLRVRDADPNGKTYGTSDLAAAGETVLANRLFKFGLANATDLKISETDVNIDANTPYTGMTLTIHPTAQSEGGAGELVGGPFNFGFVIQCNNGTDIEVYEWVQRQLRKTVDIDADVGADNIGVMLNGLMRFLGDALEAGSVDGGLTFPVNPDAESDNAGVFLDNLNAASRNTTTMFDNLGTIRGYPIGTTITLDFNQTLIDDTLAEYTLFFDFTVKTNVTDLIVTAVSGETGTFNSAGANLPVLDVGAGAYVRLEDLTGGDAAMNGIYQVTAETSTTIWNVTRYDGATIVTTAVAANDIDEHPFDSPDAIIVDSNVPAPVTGLASADFVFTFDYSNNVQGGRTGATDAIVKGKAIGQDTAQYTESALQTIQSAIALTIPFTSQVERNFTNP